MNDEQLRIKQLAEELLATINRVVPNSTIHYAVEDGRRALAELIRMADTITTAEPQDDDEIIIAPVRFWVEPIGFGDGRYGPFRDEVEASGFMDSSDLISDGTHKIVPYQLDLPDGVTLERPAVPVVAPPEGHLYLVLKIENTYENYDDVTTYAVATVPAPPAEDDEDEYDEWKMTHIIDPYTGVGHTDGDSWYDVDVVESSAPDLIPVGTKYDFGY